MIHIENMIDFLQGKQTKIGILEEDLKGYERKKKKLIKNAATLEDTRAIFQKASKITQFQLGEKISKIVSAALKTVFREDPYGFKAEFVERRNTTECDLLLIKDGQKMHPMESCGYGVADIISLALRISYWKLDGTARNSIWMDEPTRNLSADKQHLASLMIKKLSEEGIQFVVVTHREEMTDAADRVFKTNSKGVDQL